MPGLRKDVVDDLIVYWGGFLVMASDTATATTTGVTKQPWNKAGDPAHGLQSPFAVSSLGRAPRRHDRGHAPVREIARC